MAAVAEKYHLKKAKQTIVAKEEKQLLLLLAQWHMKVYVKHLVEKNQAILAAYKVQTILQAKYKAQLAVPLVGRTKRFLLSMGHDDTVGGIEVLQELTIVLSITSGISPKPFSAGQFL